MLYLKEFLLMDWEVACFPGFGQVRQDRGCFLRISTNVLELAHSYNARTGPVTFTQVFHKLNGFFLEKLKKLTFWYICPTVYRWKQKEIHVNTFKSVVSTRWSCDRACRDGVEVGLIRIKFRPTFLKRRDNDPLVGSKRSPIRTISPSLYISIWTDQQEHII